MKKIFLKSMAVISLICMMLSVITITAQASNLNEKNEIYERIADEFAINNEVFIRSANNTSHSILEIYNKIYETVYDEQNDNFCESYGGAYVNDDNKLIVQYVGQCEDLIRIINKDIEGTEDSVIFKRVDNSYNTLYAEKKKLDDITQKLSRRNKLWKGCDINDFGNSIMQYYIDEKNNKLHITLKSSSQTQGITIEDDSIDLTILGIENESLIDYEYITGELELYSGDEYVYAGQAIYSIVTSGGSITNISRISIGLRGQYIGTDSTPHFGFLTAAHGFYNNYVFIRHGTTLYKIGEVKWGYINDNLGIDAAFVALDSGYDMTNTVYFSSYYPYPGETGPFACDNVTSPSSTGDEIYFRNYYTYMPSGYAIYSNGSTTGKTTGTIVSFDTTINIDGDYYYHFCSVTNPFNHGDSGGIMYSNAKNGGTYDSYITVGMVEGGDVTDNIAFISTYYRLRKALNENISIMGNITFLTLY